MKVLNKLENQLKEKYLVKIDNNILKIENLLKEDQISKLTETMDQERNSTDDFINSIYYHFFFQKFID